MKTFYKCIIDEDIIKKLFTLAEDEFELDPGAGIILKTQTMHNNVIYDLDPKSNLVNTLYNKFGIKVNVLLLGYQLKVIRYDGSTTVFDVDVRSFSDVRIKNTETKVEYNPMQLVASYNLDSGSKITRDVCRFISDYYLKILKSYQYI